MVRGTGAKQLNPIRPKELWVVGLKGRRDMVRSSPRTNRRPARSPIHKPLQRTIAYLPFRQTGHGTSSALRTNYRGSYNGVIAYM